MTPTLPLGQLCASGADSLAEYNRLNSEKLPCIVVVFDEFASILAEKPFETAIKWETVQLLQKSRAAGFNIFISTQYPSVKVIDNAIKVNATMRIAGRTLGQAASKTILDVGDADALPDIQGRMLARLGPDLWPIQTPFASKGDIQRAIDLATRWQRFPITALPEMELPADPLSFGNIIQLALKHNMGKLTGK